LLKLAPCFQNLSNLLFHLHFSQIQTKYVIEQMFLLSYDVALGFCYIRGVRTVMMKHTTGEQVYRFIQTYIATHGYPPDTAEIAEGCEMTSSMVTQELISLEMHRRITRKPGKPRGIWLMEKQTQPISLAAS
jgi:hypothetical protein